MIKLRFHIYSDIGIFTHNCHSSLYDGINYVIFNEMGINSFVLNKFALLNKRKKERMRNKGGEGTGWVNEDIKLRTLKGIVLFTIIKSIPMLRVQRIRVYHLKLKYYPSEQTVRSKIKTLCTKQMHFTIRKKLLK